MNARSGWDEIEAEARDAFAGEGRFPLPAYSELMPPPYVALKPYAPRRADRAASIAAGEGDVLDISEQEQAHEIAPGLGRIAGHLLTEIDRLVHGAPHDFSRALAGESGAWSAALAETAAARRAAGEPIVLALSICLSRTQDDKGNVRWTLFGLSHDGPAAAFWRSFSHDDGQRFAGFVAWARATTGAPPPASSWLTGVRVLAGDPSELPAFARPLQLAPDASLDGVEALVTFCPFAALPTAVQQAARDGRLQLIPHPAGLVFFDHPGYRKLALTLPRATQIPLLPLFSHVAEGYQLRIPQSGWLDEPADRGARRSQAASHRIVRSHRWQRMARDQRAEEVAKFEDQVSVALFSTDPDDIGLYGKPMARNAQIWNEDYTLLLDGPRATPLEIARASATIDRGGRFGYRFYYPPMRAGAREIFWHLPLVARLRAGADASDTWDGPHFLGYAQAEAPPEYPDRPPIALTPRLLARPGYLEAATVFTAQPGGARLTTSHNACKLLELRELLGEALPGSFARALVHAAKHESLDAWLDAVPAMGNDPGLAGRCAALLKRSVAAATGDDAAGDPAGLTLAATHARAFEEKVWKTIAGLAEGEFRMKETADSVLVNKGKSGGPAAKAAHLELAQRRDLEALGDHLHARYRALIDAHQMTGRAEVVDHAFRWVTDFPFRWSEGWNRNQSHQTNERNVVLMIPGRDRGQALIMADHYDTAYMEDVYESERGGDGLRAAAAGADDNHSATTALLLAAEALLPLSREGKLARDVWLVHLTGEEFPSDCLGARALAQALVERQLRFAAASGAIVDVSRVRVTGAYVLDMIGHNNEHDRDVFQIAPGEGAASARLALAAHLANERWNRQVTVWNAAPERKGLGRAQRQEHGSQVPPPFAHLALRGEVRPRRDPRSALYNTDGQIFSDVGIPVVLFMENYDINRTGYHDTADTMKNIDLDYAAALTAIAIETVAAVASAP